MPPTPLTSSQRVRPPKQGRSQETLERILAAARSVLETKSFDEATLSEIVERAGVTVGAFYARFADKEALLLALEAELYESVRADMDALADSLDAEAASLGDFIRGVLEMFARRYREDRGVVRAVVLRSRSDREMQARRLAFNREVVGRGLVRMLEAKGSEIGHPDPALALNVCLLFSATALRERVLFREFWPETPEEGLGRLSDDRLVEELSRACTAYLSTSGSRGEDR